jgi:hypothetical protein
MPACKLEKSSLKDHRGIRPLTQDVTYQPWHILQKLIALHATRQEPTASKRVIRA